MARTTSSPGRPVRAELGYVILYVDDAERAFDFYSSVFGLEERAVHDGYIELDTGTTVFAVCERDFVIRKMGIPVSRAGGGSSEVVFVVPARAIRDVFERAIAYGAEPLMEPRPMPWGQTVSYVRDPDGHFVEICSPDL